MTENTICKAINSVIGDEYCWVEFSLKGESVGAIKIDDKHGFTKKEILKQFEISRIGKKQFNLWWNNRHGWACITFDDCEVRSL